MLTAGLVSATFKEKEASEVLGLCKGAGLKAIEWSEGHHVRLGMTEEAERLSSCCRDEGVEIVGLGSYYRLGQGMAFQPVLDLALALGAPLIRIWAGTKPSVAVDEAEFASLAEEAQAVGGQALKEGVQVSFEWHKNTLTDTNESALRLLQTASSCKTLWQPTVALSVEERKEGLHCLGERLANLHVYYWHDPDGKRRPLSEGISLWKEYFAQVSGDHYALLEFVMDDRVEQFKADALTLQKMVGE